MFQTSPDKCGDIHSSDCLEPILPGYIYCPTCGRRGSALIVEPRFNVTLPPSPRVFQVKGAGAVRTKFVLNSNHLRVKSAPAMVGQGYNSVLVMEVKAGAPAVKQGERGALLVSSDDGIPEDPWDQASRFQERRIIISLTAQATPLLYAVEQIGVFSDQTPTREFTVINKGGGGLDLMPPQAPEGFEITEFRLANSPWNSYQESTIPSLPPNGSITFKVRSSGARTAAREIFTLESLDGLQSEEVILRRRTGLKAQRRPKFYVGIDFGTSGTSIVLRQVPPVDDSNLDESLLTRFLEDEFGEPRFPTAIYVRLQGGIQSDFFIGQKAVEEAEKDRRHKVEGFFVEEIKTTLRGEEEPYVQYGERYTRVGLLASYLKELKRLYIDPAVDSPGATIGWCFSLPVLDSHRNGSRELYKKQRDRTEEAIKRAGFMTTGNTLTFHSEPYCAAVYLMRSCEKFRNENGEPLKDKDWVCIFDSGGGTTDVVLGQLRRHDNVWSFDEASTLGGSMLATEGPQDSESVITFGGKRVTERLALLLVATRKWAPHVLTGTEREDIDRRSRIIAAATEWMKPDTVVDLNHPWHEKNFTLLQRADEFKRDISTAAPSDELAAPTYTTDEPPTMSRADFDRLVVAGAVRPIRQTLVEKVFPSITSNEEDQEFLRPTDVKWIFAVGGNTRIRYIKDIWLPDLFGTQVVDIGNGAAGPGIGNTGDATRMLAVAGGTVWAGQSRGNKDIPYSLYVVDRDGQDIIAVFAHDSFSDNYEFSRADFELTREEPSYPLLVEIEIDGDRRRVDCVELNMPDPTQERFLIEVSARFQGRNFILEGYVEGVAIPPLTTYSF